MKRRLTPEDWKQIWEKFDAWFNSRSARCEKCYSVETSPDWDDQQKKIEHLVSATLKKNL